MAVSPTDANNYIGPPVDPDTASPIYPRWMYHPVNPPQIVEDESAEAALQQSDSRWTEADSTPTT